MSSRASLTRADGGSVTGSLMTPCAERLTFSTSRACASGGQFLWMTPMPPSFASAIASFDSVTVSIAAERIGMLTSIRRVARDCVSISVGQDLAVAREQQEVVVGDPERDVRVLHAVSPWSGAAWRGRQSVDPK